MFAKNKKDNKEDKINEINTTLKNNKKILMEKA